MLTGLTRARQTLRIPSLLAPRRPKALAFADALFDQADTNGDGKLSLAELRTVLATAAGQFSHLEEHARFLEAKGGGLGRWGGMARAALAAPAASPLADIDENTQLSKAAFVELLTKIDSGLRALPATAQVARQQGEYLASLFAKGTVTGAAASTTLPAGDGDRKSVV